MLLFGVGQSRKSWTRVKKVLVFIEGRLLHRKYQNKWWTRRLSWNSGKHHQCAWQTRKIGIIWLSISLKMTIDESRWSSSFTIYFLHRDDSPIDDSTFFVILQSLLLTKIFCFWILRLICIILLSQVDSSDGSNLIISIISFYCCY